MSGDDRPEIVPLVLGALGVLIVLSSCGQMLLGVYEAGAIVLAVGYCCSAGPTHGGDSGCHG